MRDAGLRSFSAFMAIALCAGIATALLVAAAPPATRPEAKYGLPSQDYIERTGFIQARPGHDTAWSMCYLTPNRLYGKVSRTGESWKADPDQPKEFRWSPGDYIDSEFDKGHETDAASCSWSSKAEAESFVITNAFPQNSALNRGQWAQLEKHVRDKVTGSKLEACELTGPAYVPDENGVIKIRALGPGGRIHVPTHCYKSVLYRAAGEKPGSEKLWIVSYLIPNEAIKDSFEDYKVSTDALESVLALDLWAGLPDDLEDELEAHP